MNSETLETLTITGATDKDGDYQCTATDDASKVTAKSAKTNVEFKTLTVDKPSGVHYGVVGEAFVLTCTADSGLSNPTYKWFDKDGEMNSETLETLTITGATDKDGDYQCTATDDASKATAKSAKTNVEFKTLTVDKPSGVHYGVVGEAH